MMSIRTSLQTKFFLVCTLLVLLSIASTSGTYYLLTKQDKQRESRQRIEIAFDIILDGLANQLALLSVRVDEFLNEQTISRKVCLYTQDVSRENPRRPVGVHLLKVATELKRFGHLILPDRMLLYDDNQELLIAYQHLEKQETVGGYVLSEKGKTYLEMDDPSLQDEILSGEGNSPSDNPFSLGISTSNVPFPENPLPSGISARYEGNIPKTVTNIIFHEEGRLGIRIIAPVFHQGNRVGVLLCDVFFTQTIVERYAELSKTHINIFAGTQFSVGTLEEQTEVSDEPMSSCFGLIEMTGDIPVYSLKYGEQRYYQGKCAFQKAQQNVGVMTVSLSQELEQQEVRKIVKVVFTISGIAVGAALLVSLLLSRRTIHSILNIVHIIGLAADGDLRKKAAITTHDEVALLSTKLNQMIEQLRTISAQIQGASHSVNSTADTILREMNSLTVRMEQQSASVDSTAESFETINNFTKVIRNSTGELLTAAEHILSSLHEIRSSREGVTEVIGELVTNLQHISSSVDLVNESVKHISEGAEQLASVAGQTEDEIRRIDHALEDVSQNADQSQQLAKDTMNAALKGQTAVEDSIRGIVELKDVVSETAQMIQEANTWGEQVSSILTIVDEITEQTALLSLNAAIISAQAGEHGRGFAVVADEIKELATRTKASTREIGGLIRTLQERTRDGVKNVNRGISKADEGVKLVSAVRDALTLIIERATHTSKGAADTADVIQHTAASSRTISLSMKSVTEMVSTMRVALQKENGDITQVVEAVENIRTMSEQVKQASINQNVTSGQIVGNMQLMTEKLGNISTQTQELRNNSKMIVEAIRTVDSITESILADTLNISNKTANNLVQQADVLQRIVNIFKVS